MSPQHPPPLDPHQSVAKRNQAALFLKTANSGQFPLLTKSSSK